MFSQEHVFMVYVFGAARSGKTSLLKAFVNKPFTKNSYAPTTKPFCATNSVKIKGAEKYLVLQEFGSKYESEILQNKHKMEACDLLCFVFDSSDVNSFSYIVELRKRHNLDNYPTVFVATKNDSDLVKQHNEVQPDAYCRALGLSGPISVSVKKKQTTDLWNHLIKVATNPIPATPGLSAHKVKRYLTFTAVMGALGGAVILGYRLYHGNMSRSELYMITELVTLLGGDYIRA